MAGENGTPIIRVEKLRKSFGALEVLKGISFSVARGSVVSIIGASGSGKSTLLRCLNLLERPSDGEIWVGGARMGCRAGSDRPAGAAEIARQRRALGMVFQQFNLWPHKTVLENVIEAPIHVGGVRRAAALERARALLAKVNLLDKADSYPARLSGGQQQRVAIARALAMQPEVMLFDEPTSSLDPELTGEVLEVMRRLGAEGTTMLVVTHEMGFARSASDRVMFLHDGLIEEDGPPGQVLGDPRSERCRQFLSKVLN
jgi:ABC-type histidine transport system ATPase subunit